MNLKITKTKFLDRSFTVGRKFMKHKPGGQRTPFIKCEKYIHNSKYDNEMKC